MAQYLDTVRHFFYGIDSVVESINAKKTIINLFQKLYEEANITGASSHSGRRQFVTELADKGINARVIQALARHKHLNTTMRYIDINENKMRSAIDSIA